MAEPAPTVSSSHRARGGGTARPAAILGAIGIVFGDIGTSPLYTFQECVSAPLGAPATDPANVMGVTSLIAWAVTFVVTIKYLLFLMRADNGGEGGIMALLALVPERLRSAAPGKVGAVALLVIIGAALLFGDGIITPAISVLSAVEGLGAATASLKPMVVPITVAILIGLFAIQRRGTGGLGKLFGPVMVAWFVTISVVGVLNILRTPAILGALSPYQGVAFFTHHGWRGFKLLGGVVLAVTGGEALYADMGHFGARPIRTAWLALVYPALLLCYLGQGANLLSHPEQAGDPFYSLLGGNRLYIFPMVLLASAATVIASQALICGVFSLTHQAIRLGFFPRVEVRHTSSETEGQIFVPLLNWFLAISCVLLVLVFHQSNRLAAAYGLAVSGTMLITSIIFFLVTRFTWKWSAASSIALLIFFLSFDVPFVLANSMKFLEGGYLPFAVGLLFTLVMVSWRIGRGLIGRHFAGEPPLDAFLEAIGRDAAARIPGTVVVMASNPERTPPVLARIIQRFHVIHELVLLLTVATVHTPTVDDAQRLEVHELGHGFARAIARYGFTESPDVPAMAARALAQVGTDTRPEEILYALGRETMVVTPRGAMDRVTEPIFALLARNARSATDYFAIPPRQVVELGEQIDL